jgi:ketosteroid isomerase-like protein
MASDVNRAQVAEWLKRYEQAWRSTGTDVLGTLFTEDAAYRMSPYEQAATGLEAIGAVWEDERQGPDEEFTMASEIVALEGDTAVVRAEVYYGDPEPREYRDLWVIRFAEDGRCRTFEEWPFWPGQPLSAREG